MGFISCTKRIEIPEYPLDALRELVLNAVIHRDYLSPADIQIKIFDNYITFFNPGQLHSNLTIDDLKTNSYPAYARNKLIAEAFYLTGDIEKYGSGFLRIRDAISSYPTMKIDFKEIGGGFMVTVSYSEQRMSTVTFEKGTEKGTEKITVNQQKILESIEKDTFITQEELTTIVGISLSKIKANVAKLKSKGLIERIGPDKGGYWKVIKK